MIRGALLSFELCFIQTHSIPLQLRLGYVNTHTFQKICLIHFG